MFTDQVVRLQAFQQAHPGVTIDWHRKNPGGHWTADWTDPAGGSHRLVEIDLQTLLDSLGRLLG
jgi:hypothetical protein